MNINPMRLTGLATGMDTASMVKQMMQPYTMRIDKLKQDRQIVQWRQDLYRDVIGNVGSFKRNYFDVLKADKYMLSSNSTSAFAVSGLTDNSVNVRASATAKTGNYEVTVTKLATAAEIVDGKSINTVVAGQSNYGIKVDDNNNDFTVNGTSFSLDVDPVKGYNKYSNLLELATAMNSKMASTSLNGAVKAVVKDNSIQFMELVNLAEDKVTPANSTNKITFNYSGKDYEITLAAGKYTADELVSSINSKLSGLKATDGNTLFPSDKTIAATTDGSGTIFKIGADPITVKQGELANIDINPKALTFNAAEITTGTDL
jgi:flagellar hook-associated protein 2